MKSVSTIINEHKDRVKYNNVNATYYVSSNKGNDSNDGLSEHSPWQTLAKVQTESSGFTSGDIIGFRGGDEFYGNLSLTNLSGASGNPITFTSYGTGKGVIKGSQPITGWVNTGGNIWSASTSGNTVYQVFKDGNVVTNARIPSLINNLAYSQNYYNITTAIGDFKTQFRSTDLSGYTTADLSGATCHVMSSDWVLEPRIITGFNDTTYEITLDSDVSYNMEVTDEFFINGNVSLLTTANEWAYNSGKLYVYSTTKPKNIVACTLDDTAISLTGCSHITIDNIKINHFNDRGVYAITSPNLTVKNTNFDYCYYDGIWIQSGDNANLIDNTINGSNWHGFYVFSSNSNYLRNLFTNIQVFSNITSYIPTLNEKYNSFVILMRGENNLIKHNSIINCGYVGYGFDIGNVHEENYIKNHCLTMHDGGAFYPNIEETPPYVGSGIIRNNIIDGFDFDSSWLSNGIYFDGAKINGIEVYGNTIMNGHTALFYQNTYNVNVHDNVLYNPSVYASLFTQLTANVLEGEVSGNTFSSNEVFIKSKLGVGVRINSQYAHYDVGTFDNNNYYTVYNETPMWISATGIPANTKMRLEQWQTSYLLEDLNSTQNQVLWADYQVNSVDLNLFTSDFTTDLDGFSISFGVGTRIDNGGGNWSLELNPDATTQGQINSPFLNLVSGNTYTLEFDAKGDGVGSFIVQVISNVTNLIYDSIYPQSTWTSYKLQFTAIADVANGRVRWYSLDDKNLEIMNAIVNEVTLIDIQERNACVYNETSRTKNVQIPPGQWEDLNGNKYTNTITLEPFTSEILISLNKKFYYVSTSGSDANDGLTEATPWQTLAKVQAESSGFTSGDTISFKGGDEFYGNLTLTGLNGVSGSPITFTSYGTGKAIIKGSKTISGWVDTGGNIWSADTGSDDVYQVFKNNDVITNARTPEYQGDYAADANYYQVESVADANTTFTCSSLTGMTLVGGMVHMQQAPWDLKAREIASFNSGTGEVTLDSDIGTIDVGDIFFVNNHESLLATQNEWYYSGNTLLMYSVSKPTGITINTLDDDGITVDLSTTYVDINNLEIRDFNKRGINLTAVYLSEIENVNITNNTIKYCYDGGVSADYGSYVNVNDNIIQGCQFVGIWHRMHNSSISRNEITEIGLLNAQTGQQSNTSYGISTNGSDCVVENNNLTKLGYIGIDLHGENGMIRNNYISDWCMTLHDGGAIYAFNGTTSEVSGSTGTSVLNNVCIGYDFSLATSIWGAWFANGIYFDHRTNNMTVIGNTVANTYSGLIMQDNHTITATNNNIYNIYDYAIIITKSTTITDTNYTHDLNLSYNNVLSNNAEFTPFIITNTQTALYDFGTYDYNKYINYYNFGTSAVRTTEIVDDRGYGQAFRYDLAGFNDLTGQEASSMANTSLRPNFTAINYSDNLITNGDFENGTWNLGWTPQTGTFTQGTDKTNYGIFTATGNALLKSPSFDVTSGTSYVINFDARADSINWYNFKVQKDSGLYNTIYTRDFNVNDTWNSYSLSFTCVETDVNMRFMSYAWLGMSGLSIDNLVVREADVSEPLKTDMLVYNETSVAKYVALPGEDWVDLDGNSYKGRIELQPYSSKILIQEGTFKFEASTTNVSVSGLTNLIGDSWTVQRNSSASYIEDGIVKYAETLSDNLLLNGDFELGDNGDWTLIGSGTTISGGTAHVNGDGAVGLLIQHILIEGYTYRVEFDITDWDDGTGNTNEIINSDGSRVYLIIGNGHHYTEWVHGIANTGFYFRSRNGGSYNVDNVIVKEVNYHVPRIQDGKVLIEPEIINEIVYSENIGHANWAKWEATVDGGYLAPDGNNTAWGLIPSVVNEDHHISDYIPVVLGETFTFSAFLKKGGKSWARLWNTTVGYADFDLANGVIGTTFSCVPHMEYVGNGWYRCSITYTAINSSNNNHRVYAMEGDDDRIFTGDGVTVDTYIWGIQREEQPSVTSYVKTSGATATRKADIITNTVPVDTTRMVEWIDGAEKPSVSVSSGDIITMKNGTTKMIMDDKPPYVVFEFDVNAAIPSVSGLTNTVGPDWLVNRDSVANEENSGVLTEVAAHVPRISDGKVQIEGKSTNFVANSEDVSLWYFTSCSATTNTTIAPNGTTTADKLVMDDSLGVHELRQFLNSPVGFFSGDVVTITIHAKAAEMSWFRLNTNQDDGLDVWFDLTNGVMSGDTELSSMREMADGWFECKFTVLLDESKNGFWYISLAEAYNDVNVQGDGVSGIYLWGAKTSYDNSSYIAAPTSADVVREADDIRNTVPAGVSRMTEWVDGVAQDSKTVLSGETIRMQNGTTRIEMDNGRPILGPELVTNGYFDTDSGWSKVLSSVSGGTGNLDVIGSTSMLLQDMLTVGITYRCEFDVTNWIEGGDTLVRANDATVYHYITGNGHQSFDFTHTDGTNNGFLLWRADGSGVFSIDNVSVREVL